MCAKPDEKTWVQFVFVCVGLCAWVCLYLCVSVRACVDLGAFACVCVLLRVLLLACVCFCVRLLAFCPPRAEMEGPRRRFTRRNAHFASKVSIMSSKSAPATSFCSILGPFWEGKPPPNRAWRVPAASWKAIPKRGSLFWFPGVIWGGFWPPFWEVFG